MSYEITRVSPYFRNILGLKFLNCNSKVQNSYNSHSSQYLLKESLLTFPSSPLKYNVSHRHKGLECLTNQICTKIALQQRHKCGCNRDKVRECNCVISTFMICTVLRTGG
jgi:hypothetical protein